MKFPASSDLNCLITIQGKTVSNDGFNTPTWSEMDKKWGKIETATPTESELSGRIAGEVSHVLTFRYTETILADHRLLYKGQVFQIEGKPINEGMANVITKVFAKEITDG